MAALQAGKKMFCTCLQMYLVIIHYYLDSTTDSIHSCQPRFPLWLPQCPLTVKLKSLLYTWQGNPNAVAILFSCIYPASCDLKKSLHALIQHFLEDLWSHLSANLCQTYSNHLLLDALLQHKLHRWRASFATGSYSSASVTYTNILPSTGTEPNSIFIYPNTDQFYTPCLVLQLFQEFESGLNNFERVTQLGNGNQKYKPNMMTIVILEP